MRLLSDLEKNVCNRILKNSGSNNFLANIIDNDLKGVCVLVNRNPKNASLLFTIKSQNPTLEEQKHILNKTEELSLFILQIVNLLKMLEKEGYILLLERGFNSNQSNKFGRCVTNLPSVSFGFNDQNIIDLLCEYTNKEIYSTEEFKRFCNNDYVPRDEQRFRRQILLTQCALGIAILALLFNIFINSKVKPVQKIEIEGNQYNSLKNSIDSFKKEIIINRNQEKNISSKSLNNRDKS